MEIFPECNPVCKDCSRIFFGGKGLIFVNKNINTDTFNISDLMFSLVEYYRDKDSINYLRLIKAYSEKVGIDLKNGYPKVEIIDEMQKSEISGATPIIYSYIGNAPRISIFNDNLSYAIYLSDIVKKTKITKTKTGNEEVITYESVNTKTGKRDLLRNFDFRDLIDSCKLFSEFAYGERWCYHNELWGIATNLCQIKGGGDAFIRAITNEFNEQHESYREKDWGYYVNYIQKQDYFPQQCVNFCPYANECNHGKNMILTGKTKRNTIVELSNKKEYVSLTEAEKDLNDRFIKVQGSNDNNVHVIKAQTGIGKSYTYINLLENSDKPYIIAAPTNKLKEEIYEKCIEKGYDVIETPTLPLNIPDDIKDEIDKLYEIGAIYSASKFIRRVAKEQEIPALTIYIEDLEMIQDFQGHIITTHNRLLFFSETKLRHYNILIDEDILKTLFQINKVKVKDLMKLLSLKYISIEDKEKIKSKFDCILNNHKYMDYIITEPVHLENNSNFEKQIVDEESNISTNAIGFLESCCAYRYNPDKDKMDNASEFYSDYTEINTMPKTIVFMLENKHFSICFSA